MRLITTRLQSVHTQWVLRVGLRRCAGAFTQLAPKPFLFLVSFRLCVTYARPKRNHACRVRGHTLGSHRFLEPVH